MLFVAVHCSESTILKRLVDPGRARFTKLNSPDLYRKLESQGAFQFPALPEPLIIVDTETLDPEAAARAIARVLPQSPPRSSAANPALDAGTRATP